MSTRLTLIDARTAINSTRPESMIAILFSLTRLGFFLLLLLLFLVVLSREIAFLRCSFIASVSFYPYPRYIGTYIKITLTRVDKICIFLTFASIAAARSKRLHARARFLVSAWRNNKLTDRGVMSIVISSIY